MAGTSLAIVREVSLEESEITNSVDQGHEVTTEIICRERRNSALVGSSPVKEVGDGVEGCGGGFEVFVERVCAATQKYVVDAVGFVAKQLWHVHIHRGGS